MCEDVPGQFISGPIDPEWIHVQVPMTIFTNIHLVSVREGDKKTGMSHFQDGGISAEWVHHACYALLSDCTMPSSAFEPEELLGGVGSKPTTYCLFCN